MMFLDVLPPEPVELDAAGSAIPWLPIAVCVAVAAAIVLLVILRRKKKQ